MPCELTIETLKPTIIIGERRKAKGVRNRALRLMPLALGLIALCFDLPVSGQSTLCTGNLGSNIFLRGNFGSGPSNVLLPDPKLAPGYIYQPSPPPNDGYYTITNNTSNWGSFARDTWVKTKDNSSDPNGYFMVVNASLTPGLFYLDTVDVCGSTDYVFSADVITMNDPATGTFIQPNLSFLVDGKEVYSTGNVPMDRRWHTYGFALTTQPGTTRIVLALRNNAPGGIGNDLGLDNISFLPCGPRIMVPDTTIFCVDTAPITLQAQVSGAAYNNPVYQWQTSTDLGQTWTNIAGAVTTSHLISTPRDGHLFRMLAADGPLNLSTPSCRVNSDVAVLEKKVFRTSVNVMICPGGSYSNWGQRFTSPGEYEVRLRSRDGCDSLITCRVQVEDLSGFAIQGPEFVCADSSAVLQAGSFKTYLWSDGSRDSFLTAVLPGTYAVTVTSENGCQTSDTHLLEEIKIIGKSFAVDPVCFGGKDGRIGFEALEGGRLPFQYAVNGGRLQDAPQFAGLGAGGYTLQARDAQGCTFSIALELNNPAPFRLETGGNQVIRLGDRIFMEASANQPVVSYAWQPTSGLTCSDCPNPVVSPDTTTTYWLEAINEPGCVIRDSVLVTVVQVRYVYAPNVFSPNGDGVNDRFTLFLGRGVVEIRQLQVFTRWGTLVFQSAEPGSNSDFFSWDGRLDGKPLPEDVYVWRALVRFTDGKAEELKGEVVLVR